jgi:hypothetical protein
MTQKRIKIMTLTGIQELSQFNHPDDQIIIRIIGPADHIEYDNNDRVQVVSEYDTYYTGWLLKPTTYTTIAKDRVLAVRMFKFGEWPKDKYKPVWEQSGQ